jgi:hypothetical protein
MIVSDLFAAQLPTRVAITAPTILGALLAAIAAAAMLAYSWHRTREPWIGWLIVVWLLWIARYVVGLLPGGMWPLGDPRQVVILLLRDFALAMAIRHLGVRWFAPVWVVAAIPLVVASVLGEVGTWYGWYLFHLLGAPWLLAALVVARSARLWGAVRLTTAGGFLLHAVLIASTPWYGGAGSLVSASVALATAVHLAVASGVAVGVHQRMLDEQEEAERRVARALEYVVRGVVPMCAYCRSVRDRHGAWVTLDRFVAEGTAEPVVEVRCPDCAVTSPAPSSRSGAPVGT